jgi:endonuclease-3
MTTPELFRHFPDAKSMSGASEKEIFNLIKSISYPNNKTKHLIGTAKILDKEYGGKVPMTVEELIKLPGVGRKTANVVTSVEANQPNLAVDTHVFRVSARLGLTTGAKTPLAAEKQLLKHLPTNYITRFHHWLIMHGRYICKARNPLCGECPLQEGCKFYAKSVRSTLNR